MTWEEIQQQIKQGYNPDLLVLNSILQTKEN